MKADVAPPKLEINRSPLARSASPELDIPLWVPETIAQFVRTAFAADIHRAYAKAICESEKCDDDEAHALAECNGVRAAYAADDIVRDDLAEIAERYRSLVCDPRMRGVWRELSRLRNGTFLHPVRAPAMTDMKQRQEAAMLELFKTALECHHLRCSRPTQAEAERQRRRYLAKAEELEDDAITMLLPQDLSVERDLVSQPATIEDSDDDLEKEVAALLAKKHDGFWIKLQAEAEAFKTLQAAAKVYKERAHAIFQAQPSLPERKGDARARLVAVTIGNKFRALFGSPMYGLTAKITSVVLDRGVDPEAVRHWLGKP